MSVSEVELQMQNLKHMQELRMPLAVLPLMFAWADKVATDLMAARPDRARHVRFLIATDTPEVLGMAQTYLGSDKVRSQK